MFALLYWASPNAKRGFRWISPGAVVAVAGWLLASGLFALYITNFGHYNKIYGSLAAVIIFLIWLWISNLAILLGAEFDAELERGRAIAAGAAPSQEPYVELRDTRKVPSLSQAETPARSAGSAR
jgi:membrane protein